MPAGKRQPKENIFYALVVFVGLFVLTLVLAVICYIRAENYKTKAATLQNQIDDLASPSQLRRIGALVGEKQRRKTRLETILDYLDETAVLITGTQFEQTSAQVKAATARQKTAALLESIAKKYPDIKGNDPNLGLIPLIEKLDTKLNSTATLLETTQKELELLQSKFDDAIATSLEKEKTLLAEKEKFQQQVNDVQKNYNQLKTVLEQTTEQQVNSLMDQLEKERDARKKLNQEMLKNQAELKIAEDRIKRAQQKIDAIVPPPDSEVAAFQPDATILLVDHNAKIAHLNIGSDDHVYRGLTFSVYDKNLPIPKDGKGKAEVEVYNVEKNISAARIIRSSAKNPIIVGDTAANLIWDSRTTNVFVVAGEFDLDDDGQIEPDATKKIETLIENWGAKAEKTVSIDTDFLILGQTPQIPPKPTFEQIAIDPMAMEKYEDAVKSLDNYKQIEQQAQAFSIPIFNAERFLYFIGYKTQSTRPGAF